MSEKMVLHGNYLSGPTYKVGLMLSLCGLPFDYRHIDLAAGAHKSAEFLAVNKFGQVPALTVGERHFAQSNVILMFLAERTGKFLAAGDDRWRMLEWLQWEQDRLYPGVTRCRFFTRFVRPEPPVLEYFTKAANAGLDVLNDWLRSHDWVVASGPTIADVAIYSVVQQAPEGNLDLAPRSAIGAWMRRVEDLAGFGAPRAVLSKSDRVGR